MKNFYQELIQSSVEGRIKKHQRRGETFNRDKIVKEMEAIHPIYLFMLFSGLLFFIDGALKLGIFIIIGPFMFLIFFFMILIGLNHYFGWVKIMNKD
tara:strand:+ start:500 stop:790 length:291 start_codon:yes stop_codon:yes gene_type:complete